MVREFTLYDFDKGLNLTDDPAMIGDKEFSQASNIIVNNGMINVVEADSATTLLPSALIASDSGGYTKTQGMFEYNDTNSSGNPATLLSVYNGKIFGAIDTTTPQCISAGLNTTNPVNFAKFGDGKVYLVDGDKAVKSLYNKQTEFILEDFPAFEYADSYKLEETKYFVYADDYYLFGYNPWTGKLELYKYVTGDSKYRFLREISSASSGFFSNLVVANDNLYAFETGTKKIKGYTLTGTLILDYQFVDTTTITKHTVREFGFYCVHVTKGVSHQTIPLYNYTSVSYDITNTFLGFCVVGTDIYLYYNTEDVTTTSYSNAEYHAAHTGMGAGDTYYMEDWGTRLPTAYHTTLTPSVYIDKLASITTTPTKTNIQKMIGSIDNRSFVKKFHTSIKYYDDSLYFNLDTTLYKLTLPANAPVAIITHDTMNVLSEATIYIFFDINNANIYMTVDGYLNIYDYTYTLVSTMLLPAGTYGHDYQFITCGYNFYKYTAVIENYKYSYETLPFGLESTTGINSVIFTHSPSIISLEGLTVGSAVSGTLRAGRWYFAYQVYVYNRGLQYYTALSDIKYFDADGSHGVTLNFGITNIAANDIIYLYARHETEVQFYQIEQMLYNVTTFDVTDTEVPVTVFYEERDNYNPPPIGCGLIKAHRDMMWYVKDDTMYVSNYNQALNVPREIMTETGDFMGGVYQVGNDKMKITAMHDLNGYLFIFKEDGGTYRITGDPGDLSSFRIDKISELGCKDQYSVCDDGKFIYVYNKKGIYFLNEQGYGESLSHEIDGDANGGLLYIYSGTVPYIYSQPTRLCYHRTLRRLILITAGSYASCWCLNMNNKTWTTITTNTYNDIPIQLSYIGNDLYYAKANILYKKFSTFLKSDYISLTTKRFNFPSPALYKRFDSLSFICDGGAGLTFSNTDGAYKSDVIIDGTTMADESTIVYPGTASIRQKIRNRTQKCFNYAVKIIGTLSSGNAIKHSISSLTFKINEKGGIR